MERVVWLRAGMFATIIVLVALIFTTPNLVGNPPQLASLPILIVAMTHDRADVIIEVTAAVQAYLYDNITVNVTHADANNVTVFWQNYSENDTYGLGMKLPANLTSWHIHVWLLDTAKPKNYFEYNMTVWTFNDTDNGGRLTFGFKFPDDNSSAVAYAVPPDDYRIAIPRRGTLP